MEDKSRFAVWLFRTASLHLAINISVSVSGSAEGCSWAALYGGDVVKGSMIVVWERNRSIMVGGPSLKRLVFEAHLNNLKRNSPINDVHDFEGKSRHRALNMIDIPPSYPNIGC